MPIASVAALNREGTRVRFLARIEPGFPLPSEVPLGDYDFETLGVPVAAGPLAGLALLRLLISSLKGCRGATGVVATQPGIVGAVAVIASQLARLPLVVQVVGDPAEALVRGVVPGIRRVPARVVLVAMQKFACRRAGVVRYVTRETLQRRYPPGRRTRSFSASDVQVVAVTEAHAPSPGPWTVVTVATLDVPYKGVGDLVEAVRIVRSQGLDVRLKVVGGGRLLEETRGHAETSLGRHVTFTGKLTAGASVAAELRSSDLFVLASWTEGLPRAMVEAMAAGLPAVGTNVGGIPELLPPDALCPPRRPDMLARRIKEVLTSPERYVANTANAQRVARVFMGSEARQEFGAFARAAARLMR